MQNANRKKSISLTEQNESDDTKEQAQISSCQSVFTVKCEAFETTENNRQIKHVAPCKRIHEGPGFWIPASRFRIPASGFWIPTLWIPDSNLLDSGFHTKAVDSGFQTIVDSGFQSLDSRFSYMGRNMWRLLSNVSCF